MIKKIIFYNLDGTVDSTKSLNKNNLKYIVGLMTKCTLSNNTTIVGYADPFRFHEDFDGEILDYIYLWKWDLNNQYNENPNVNCKQSFYKVMINEIVKIESISLSNPRWGSIINEFEYDSTLLDVDQKKSDSIDIVLDGIYCPNCKEIHPVLYWHDKYDSYLDESEYINTDKNMLKRFKADELTDIELKIRYYQRLSLLDISLSNVEGECIVCGCKTIFKSLLTGNFVCSEECKYIEHKISYNKEDCLF